MAITLGWKVGFEVELMAPAGLSRRDLAERAATRIGGAVQRFFHPQSEASAVGGRPVFENLTPGFRVTDGRGCEVASYVDDLTLQRDLDRERPPREGWRRIVADDSRLLRLVARHCDPDAPGDSTLEPLSAMFGTALQRHPAGMVKVVDDQGRSVAIDAPLPGERERPCEIVTAPLVSEAEIALEALLDDARPLGFAVPVEGATHVHFDAEPLCSARAISALVTVFSLHGEAIKRLVGTNSDCVRLGAWPGTLTTLTRAEAFRSLDWPSARVALGEAGLIKYCDVNLLNLLTNRPDKHTVEVRVLPALLDAGPLIAAAALFEGVLGWCRDSDPGETPPDTLLDLLLQAPMDDAARRIWLDRLRQDNAAIAGGRTSCKTL